MEPRDPKRLKSRLEPILRTLDSVFLPALESDFEPVESPMAENARSGMDAIIILPKPRPAIDISDQKFKLAHGQSPRGVDTTSRVG